MAESLGAPPSSPRLTHRRFTQRLPRRRATNRSIRGWRRRCLRMSRPIAFIALESGKCGSPAWIRTTIHGSKGRCPTVRRPGKKGEILLFSLTTVSRTSKSACASLPLPRPVRDSPEICLALPRAIRYNHPGSHIWPVLGAGFKPVVRYFVPQVGSTPTGFRQTVFSQTNSRIGRRISWHPFVILRIREL